MLIPVPAAKKYQIHSAIVIVISKVDTQTDVAVIGSQETRLAARPRAGHRRESDIRSNVCQAAARRARRRVVAQRTGVVHSGSRRNIVACAISRRQ